MKLVKRNIVEMIALIVLMSGLVSATECVGQNCGAGMTLNVTNETIIIVPISPLTSNAIYQSLASTGAGIGSFLQFMTSSIPELLLIIAIVGGIIAIIYGIIAYMKKSMVSPK